MYDRIDSQLLADLSEEIAAGDNYIRLHQVVTSGNQAEHGDFFGEASSFSQTVTKLDIPCMVHWIRGYRRLRIVGKYIEVDDGDVLIREIPVDYKDVIHVGDIFDVFDADLASTNEMIVSDFYPDNVHGAIWGITGRKHT